MEWKEWNARTWTKKFRQAEDAAFNQEKEELRKWMELYRQVEEEVQR